MKVKLGILFIILCAFINVGCSNKNENKNNKEISNNTSDLYKFRTKYIGDNSKVVSIASGIDYGKYFQYEQIEIKTDLEPYILKVKLKVNNDEKIDFFNQAVITFSLIDNLSNLEYINYETGDIIEKFTREECNNILKEKIAELNNLPQHFTIEKIGENKENFSTFINNI